MWPTEADDREMGVGLFERPRADRVRRLSGAGGPSAAVNRPEILMGVWRGTLGGCEWGWRIKRGCGEPLGWGGAYAHPYSDCWAAGDLHQLCGEEMRMWEARENGGEREGQSHDERRGGQVKTRSCLK